MEREKEWEDVKSEENLSSKKERKMRKGTQKI